MIYNNKHLLDLKSLTSQEIFYILNTAQKMKYILQKGANQSPELKNKTVATLFVEESSRSKLSFELAAQHLSANVVNIFTKADYSQESLLNLGQTIDQMGVNFVVIRHPLAGAAHHLSKYVKASVINAGDGENENPTQALIDLFMIKEHKSKFENLKVAIIGDIKHNRVAKSNLWVLKKLGAEVSVAGPPTLIPSGLEDYGVKVFYSITEALIDADVIITLAVQTKRQENNLIPSLSEYTRFYKLDNNRLKCAKPDAIIIHPGHINRGIEISSQIIDNNNLLLYQQSINSIAVRMAVFHILTRGGLNFHEHTN